MDEYEFPPHKKPKSSSDTQDPRSNVAMPIQSTSSSPPPVPAKVANALKDGSVSLNIVKCLFQGPPRVGKTHVKSLVLKQKIEHLSLSTGWADHPERAVRTEKYAGIASEEWEVMDDDKLTAMIAQAIHQLRGVDQHTTEEAHMSHADRVESAQEVIRQISYKVAGPSASEECPQDLMYLIDSGGQPQFQEVLQAFIPNTTTLLLAFNLTQKLCDSPLMIYKADQASHSLGRFAISNEEIISQFARMVYSSNKKVQVALIGTYHDKYLPFVHETIEEKNARLLEIFSFCKDRLLYQDARSNSLLFPINGLQAEEGIFDDPMVCKLRSAISSTTNDVERVEVPLRWYAFELALQRQANKEGRNVFSFSECMELSKDLKFPKEDVPVALEFLSKYNLILYYPTILPNVVFTTPQVLLNKVTELTECVYSLSGDTSAEIAPFSNHGEYLIMRDEGKISSRILRDFPNSYHPPLFTNDDVLKIFEHLYIIARLEGGCYFMPALLPHFSKVKLEELLDPSRPPLLYHFSDGCAPTGLFCALLVCLTSPKRGWKVHLKFKFLEGVKSNAACLEVPQLGLLCIIVDSFHQFEVHYRCAPESEQYLPIVSEAVTEGLEEVIHNREYKIIFPRSAYFCRSNHHIGLNDESSSSLQRHVATPMLVGKKLKCTVDPITAYEMNEIESKWLEPVQSPPQSAATDPTIPQLTTELNEEQAKWHTIGIFLCVPSWKLAAIEQEERSSVVRLIKALEYWQKNAEPDINPFNWDTIVKVLRQIENNRLADKLKAKYLN